MIVNRTFKAHSALLTRMADTLGVDLVAALSHGTVEPREMTGHVYRCLSCSSPDTCRTFINAHTDTGAKSAPCYCRNKQTLERMARQ